MSKPLAMLHAGLVTRALPPALRPATPPATAEVTPLRPWVRPQMLSLRPSQVEVSPAPVSKAGPLLVAAPAPQPSVAMPPAPAPRRRATTLRLDARLYARLRIAREELGRSGQSILVEALDDWLRKHEPAD